MVDKEKKAYLAIRIFLVVVFLTIFVVGEHKSFLSSDNLLKISVLDVGQGDAFLIKTPHNKKILIDGGPTSDIVGKVSQELPFFSCNLDVVLVTHSHEDHVMGINSILRKCVTPLLIINDIGSLDSLPKGNVVINSGFSGDKFSLDGVNFYILWPKKDFSSSDANEMSIVVLMEYGSFRALFTGDAESKIISSVIDTDIDFLKVPHHGSYDEDLKVLLAKIKPEIMAISVGENSFGHPSSQVLGIADSANIEVFRTDVVGDIVVTVDYEGRYKIEK